MRRLLCIRALLLLIVTIFVAGCADKKQPQQPAETVDDSVFEQVSPVAFDGVDDPELRDRLEIREKSGTLWAINEPAGVKGKFFTGSNVIVADTENPNGVELEIAFTSVTREQSDETRRIPLGAKKHEGNVVKRRSGGFEEYFANRRAGIEHGLVIAERPEGEGQLAVEVSIGGGYQAYSMSPQDVRLQHHAGPAIRYENLRVYDAKGRMLPAFMWPRNKGATARIVIEVADKDAVYPIIVDPVLSFEQQRLWPASIKTPDTCDGPLAGKCGFGRAVAMHKDVMVVGVPTAQPGANGAIQIYMRDGQQPRCVTNSDCDSGLVCSNNRCLPGGATTNGWQRVRVLRAPFASAAWSNYGFSVAISERSGRYTIVVGDPFAEGGEGRVEILEINRSQLLGPVTAVTSRQILGTGTEIGGSLNAGDQFGYDVSASPNRVVVGAPGTGDGAVWMFDLGVGKYVFNGTAKWEGGTYGVQALGSSVSTTDDILVMGAPKPSPDNKELRIAVSSAITPTTGKTWELIVEDGTGVSQTFSYTMPTNMESTSDIVQGIVADFNATANYSILSSMTQDNALGNYINLVGANPGDNFTVSVNDPDGFFSIASTEVVTTAETSGVILHHYASSTTQAERSSEPDKQGFDVHVYGNSVVAGAPENTTNGANSGGVYEYTWDGASSFTGPGFYAAPSGGQTLGTTVFTTGTVIVAGGPSATTDGTTNHGMIRNVTGQWTTADRYPFFTERGVYTSTVGGFTRGSNFGYALAWDQDPATVANPNFAVGAPGMVYDRAIDSDDEPQGAVMVYEAGTRTSFIREQADFPNMEFGTEVHTVGNMMVVSAPGHQTPYGLSLGQGVVYVYMRQNVGTRDWKLIEVIEPPSSVTGFGGGTISKIGPAVATNGTAVAVEATFGGGNKAILFYKWDGASQNFIDSGGNPGEVDNVGFGTNAIALSKTGVNYDGVVRLDWAGETLAIGMPNAELTLRVDTSNLGVSNLTPEEIDPAALGDPSILRFGDSVAVNPSGQHIAVGAPSSAMGLGRVLIYNTAASPPTFEEQVPNASPPYDAPSLGLVAGDGFGASVDMDGSNLAVGAPGSDSSKGSVFFFRYQSPSFLLMGPLATVTHQEISYTAVESLASSSMSLSLKAASGTSEMGRRVDLDQAGVAVSNDWSRDAVISFLFDGGFWYANDFSIPRNPQVDDATDGGPLWYPHSLALPDDGMGQPNYVMAGSPDTQETVDGGLQYTTGSVVFHPVDTLPPADDNCDGVDDDGDGLFDEDSCSPLGNLGCIDVVGQPGVCYTECNPLSPMCPANTTCRLNLGLSLTVCEPDEPCAAAGFSLRNGICMEECDPAADTCGAGEVCYADPTGGVLGYCAPDDANGGICSDPGFYCTLDDDKDPEQCYQGECLEPCTSDAECTAVPGGKCQPLTAFPNIAIAAGQFCDYPDACGDTWCRSGTSCYEGQCYGDCDGNPTTTGDCATTDDPVTGSAAACFVDLSTGTEAYCMDEADPCNGVFCPNDATDGAQICVDGECMEYCDAMNACSTAGEVCDTTRNYCIPSDPCTQIFCEESLTCYEGSCIEPCDPSAAVDTCITTGTSCALRPGGAGPMDGICIDTTNPCASITCPPVGGVPQTCYLGECFQTCATAMCPGGSVCDASADRCIPPDICDSVICPAGATCESGYCYGTCDPANGDGDCPVGDTCTVDPTNSTVGRCAPDVPDPCAGIVCPETPSGETQTCHEGVCYPVCVDDTDCDPPTTICFDTGVQQFCNSPDPCDTVWCPHGDVCFEGSCYESCTTSCGSTCYDNLDGTDRCATSACDGVVCPLGDVCMNGRCGAPCTTTANCPDSNLCQDGCDVAAPGSDCTLSGGGICLDAPCDGVSCPLGEVCSNGTCSTPCMNDSECTTAGELCIDGACIDDPCDPDPCGSGTCFRGGCYDECTTMTVSEDCAPGQVCESGRCTESACSGVDCPLGQVCFDGSCYDACVDDGDCTPPNLCFNGVCGSDPCDGITCPLGEVCYGGSCAPPCGTTTACQIDGDCLTAGETCQNINPTTGYGYCIDCGTDECWVNGCLNDSDCRTGDYCFKNGTSVSGVCLDAGCDPTAAPGCEDGLLSCRTSECEGVTCPLGQVCYEGSCYNPCMDNGDCTPPNQCFDGVCTDDLCRGTQCPLGQVCYGGSCYDPCIDNGDCTPPNVCFEGRCADTACSGPDGPNSVVCPLGEVCIQGGCFEACTVNTDCTEFIGTGDFTEVSSSFGLDIGSDKDGGFTWADFNKDGCLDLAVNGRGSINTRVLISDCNLPNPAYTDITPSLADHMAYNQQARSIVAGDLNNDGYADLVRTGGRIEMFLNRWDGVDTANGSTGWGINSWGRGGANTPNQDWGGNPEGAGILDYDGDQDLDFIVQNSDFIRLYRNNGSGSFTETEPGYFEADEDGDYCAVADFDVDGDVDVLCRFDKKNEGGIEGRDMYRNDGGTFSWVPWVDEEGKNGDKSGVVFCDYDNDGDFDLFWGGEGVNQFWEQPSSGNWIQTGKPTPASGFDLNQGNREVEGVDCGDVDNDGDMDLFVARGDKDKLFINQLAETGTATFVADNRGINENDSQDTEQGTFVDFDNDGDLDIYTNHDDYNHLWRNPLTGSDYLMVRPRVDLGSGVFRDAIGATITIRDPDGTMLGVREVNGGSGRGSQRQIPVHIGLSNGDNVPYHLTVQFPHDPVEVVEVCVIPNTLPGYRVLRVDNTDSDDMAACSDPNWADNIITAASGEFCFEDHCAANACDDIQCSDGFICVGGTCVESCTIDTECPNYPMDICYQNRCADANNPACDNVKCPSNQTCYAGECFKDCAGPSDCDGNQICYQGRCADPTCNKIAGNCLSGEICHQGTCFRDCSSNPSLCPAGTTCWAGRCATDSCAAMMDTYETNHIFTATGRKLTADQYSRPYFWPRPVVRPTATSINSYVAYDNVGLTSTTPDVHEANKAKVVMYLDETLADTDNPRGYYVIWLTHGAPSGAQGPARANYQVRLSHSGGAALDTLFVDDGNESYRRMTDTNQEIVIAQITSGAGTTGGIALGPLPSESQDWTVSIDASFSGGIDKWEVYNPELGNGVALKMTEQLKLRSLPISPDVVLAPEVGFACDMPPEALLLGNCDSGVLACTTANLGYTRCDQAVFPAAFEICDGEDNNCEGTVDEPLGMRVPYVQFNQNDGWKYWVPADSTDDFVTDLNFTQRGTDDRTGSTNYIGLEGTPMQATQKSMVLQHRDLVRGDLTVGFLHGANAAAGSDRNVEMNLDFPGGDQGVQSFRDAFIAYFDDGQPIADEVPKATDFGNFEIDLSWQLDEISGTRESDGVGIRPNFHQPFTGNLSYFDMEFDGTDGSNDDWTDDGLQWLMYQPMLIGADNENELLKSRELDMRVGGRGLASTFCPAATPITYTDITTGMTETCELGRYTCSSGVLSCGPAVASACDLCADDDFDGYPLYDPALCPGGTDCNDQDPEIYPGAPERCNGLDDDCDTQIDVKTNVTGTDCGPGGGAECGPAECQYRNICICPDGPETDPSVEPCYCGGNLEPGDAPAEPESADDSLFEDRGAACAAAGNSPVDGDLPLLVLVGIVGLAWRRRRM